MNLNRAIDEGLQALERLQLPNGSFQSYSSKQIDNFEQALPTQTVFQSAVMLRSLSKINHPAARVISNKLYNYLLGQMQADGSFNYWDKQSLEYHQQPYPNDLDDTFCCWQAIATYDPNAVTGEALANIAKLLIATEEAPGGPYRTWLVRDDADGRWSDVDIVVNANIRDFLGRYNVELPNIDRFVESAISRGNFDSPYYPASYVAMYGIAGWYRGALHSQYLNLLTHELTAKIATNHDYANGLLVSAYLRAGGEAKDVATAVQVLVDRQQNGVWPAAGICFDPAVNGDTWYAGSTAFSTALCLEALHYYDTLGRTVGSGVEANPLSHNEEQIWGVVERHMRSLSKPIQPVGYDLLHRVRQMNQRHFIVSLPILMAEQGLRQPFMQRYGEPYNMAEIKALGVASIYGWMAYTLYDDIIDGDTGLTALPLANICMRQMRNQFRLTIPNEDFQQYVDMVLDRMDETNAWEMHNCRVDSSAIRLAKLPDYQDGKRLAWRAGGYSLGAMGTLPLMGYQIGSEAARYLEQFFDHLLIARQLNDEAHDWEDDLRRGHINIVGRQLLDSLRREGVRKLDATQESAVLSLRERFWQQQIDVVIQDIYSHCTQARQCLRQCSILQGADFLYSMVDDLEKAAQKTLEDRNQAKDFMAHVMHRKGQRNPKKSSNNAS